MPSTKPKFMQRCVADVAGQGVELGRAYAICTAQSQKSGYTKPGSATLTAKGKGRERAFAHMKDMPRKAKEYERAVQVDKAEGLASVLARLEEARMSGRMMNPEHSIHALAVETPSGRSWRKNVQVVVDEVLAALGAVDALYADQPLFKSDLAQREKRAAVERVDKALEKMENVVGAMRSLLRQD